MDLTGEDSGRDQQSLHYQIAEAQEEVSGFTLGVCKYWTHTGHEALSGSTSDQSQRVADRPRAHTPLALQACLPLHKDRCMVKEIQGPLRSTEACGTRGTLYA